MTEAIHYPVMFTFRDAVSGHGFLAAITLSGRGLMVKEDVGDWWMYGVRPGAVAERGDTPQETFHRFRETYRKILFDIAGDSADFGAFKKEVERFYYEPDDAEERRWDDAFQKLRSGAVTAEPPFSELPKQPPENRPTQITVERLDQQEQARRFMPTDNVVDVITTAA